MNRPPRSALVVVFIVVLLGGLALLMGGGSATGDLLDLLGRFEPLLIQAVLGLVVIAALAAAAAWLHQRPRRGPSGRKRH